MLKQLSDPLSEVDDNGRREAMTASRAKSSGWSAGVLREVVPGPVEQLRGDDVVLVALGNEDRKRAELAGLDRDVRIERKGAEQHCDAAEACGIAEREAAGKSGSPLKPTKMTGRPAGATSSSQERNQVNVWLNDVATGRPIPRFSNHA